MIKNQIKTFTLLSLMTGLLLGAGWIFGSYTGLTIALIVAIAINFGSYWYSHKIILKMYNAEKISEDHYLNDIVEKISSKANIPKPTIYIIKNEQANAFATGRNPENGVIACTEGILKLLDKEELESVIAHEISHIKNRDTLINSITASIAGIISYIAVIARWTAIFGGFGGKNENGGGLIQLIILGIITPLIATLIKLAISRSREYLADTTGAKITGKPDKLISGLKKIHESTQKTPLKKNTSTQSTSHLFIESPFKKTNITQLFSTHPSLEKRIENLKQKQE